MKWPGSELRSINCEPSSGRTRTASRRLRDTGNGPTSATAMQQAGAPPPSPPSTVAPVMTLNHICENCGKPLRLGLAVTTSVAVLLLLRCKAQSSGGGYDSAAAQIETATGLLQI
jgi:hypothetical protein